MTVVLSYESLSWLLEFGEELTLPEIQKVISEGDRLLPIL